MKIRQDNLVRDRFQCEITDFLDNDQVTGSKWETYICYHDDTYVAIRIVGQTIGSITIDKDKTILDIKIGSHSFAKFRNEDKLTQFIGKKFENIEILK